ncbi:hypothetical protein C8E87_3939 [Paractinoplanes brasiliensis]|uniref:Uncharacterized protein n=1 Tax=Paractinoplanes brasiliensis TaxID=52695 RepID=A0A4V6PSX1_9ACTN|nr:hypothetical protein C8E87_3939 [Actinoplanes brasiliensis]
MTYRAGAEAHSVADQARTEAHSVIGDGHSRIGYSSAL